MSFCTAPISPLSDTAGFTASVMLIARHRLSIGNSSFVAISSPMLHAAAMLPCQTAAPVRLPLIARIPPYTPAKPSMKSLALDSADAARENAPISGSASIATALSVQMHS